MSESLNIKIDKALEMLVEYEYLLQADQVDCSVYFQAEGAKNEFMELFEKETDEKHLPSYVKCWTRKYGSTLFSLIGIFVTSSVIFYCAIGDLRARKAQRAGSNLLD